MSESQETFVSSVEARYRVALVREPSPTYNEPRPCCTAEDAHGYLCELTNSYPQEVMGAVLLNTRNRAIGHVIAYAGTLSRASVEPRGLLVPALLSNASGIIAFHNHPSGDPSPSAEDLAFTRCLSLAAELVGLNLVDHLILGEAPSYVSLRRQGGW